jgi:hypothetical protein
MTHLSELELVDVIEGALPRERRAHLDHCASCRDRAADLRATWNEATDAAVPEPSPLFWDQFSARVREAVEATDRPALSGTWLGWLRQDRLAWAAAGALVAVLVIGAAYRVYAPSPTPQSIAGRSSEPNAGDAVAPATDADPAWAVVRTVADEVLWDDAVVAGIDAEPGATERAARELSAAERSELVRILLAEAKRPGA